MGDPPEEMGKKTLEGLRREEGWERGEEEKREREGMKVGVRGVEESEEQKWGEASFFCVVCKGPQLFPIPFSPPPPPFPPFSPPPPPPPPPQSGRPIALPFLISWWGGVIGIEKEGEEGEKGGE